MRSLFLLWLWHQEKATCCKRQTGTQTNHRSNGTGFNDLKAGIKRKNQTADQKQSITKPGVLHLAPKLQLAEHLQYEYDAALTSCQILRFLAHSHWLLRKIFGVTPTHRLK
jgi:hypothetical protein